MQYRRMRDWQSGGSSFSDAAGPYSGGSAGCEDCSIRAVTNAIVHGYEEHGGRIILEASLENGILEVVITDKGVGIEDVERAMPMFTTKSRQ